MKISYSWLKDYLPIDTPSEKVADMLTHCGLEVEAIEKFQSIKGGLEGLVVGEIKSIAPHPNADKLQLTQVDIKQDTKLSIVCGATNIKVGQKVIIATVGTTLYPTDAPPFVINKSKIRGETSEGMICAEDEIGIGSDHAGVIVLDPATPIGTLAKSHYNIVDDTVFEIGLTPNRADATSHIGVARDLAAVINTLQDSSIKLQLPSIKEFAVDNRSLPLEVIVEDHEACPRYAGVTITSIKVDSSPLWLQNRLKALGLKPINNIVDITNYVLHETGQPLHAFDADMISGGKVIIKQLPDKTKFITLDEEERELSEDDLMICNAEEGMCIAGVFGGIKSGVTEKTTNIFLESAYFNPVHVRKTAKRFGLNTDASFRFERGADPNMTVYALKRAAMLIKQIAGGSISSDIVDIYPNPVDPFSVPFSYRNCDRLIGKRIDRNTIKNILTYLEIDIIKEQEEGLLLSVPPFKVDVKREADVIEEILRIYNYNRIDVDETLHSSLSYSAKPDKDKIQNNIADFLSNNGFNEIMCNSLSNSKYYKDSSLQHIFLLNPVSSELDILRQTILFGGLESILHNLNHRTLDQKLYEFGKTYHLINEPKDSTSPLDKYDEVEHLSLFFTGRKEEEHWNTSNEKVDFYLMKGYATAILHRLGISNFTETTINSNLLDEGMGLEAKGKELVMLGSVKRQLLEQLDIKQEVFYADFNWTYLIHLYKENNIQYQAMPKYPAVRRDLALLIDKTIDYASIKELALQTEKHLIKQINLFDVYQGDKISADKKSYAISFILQDEKSTLTDKHIEKTMNKLISSFKEKLNAVLR